MRQADDFYATPSSVVEAILPRVYPGGFRTRVLDPFCGDGAILRAVRAHDPSALLIGFDSVDRGCEWGTVRDAFSDEPWPEADLVIANPPFCWSEAAIRRAVREASHGATTALLLRLAMLEGVERASLWSDLPCDVYVLGRRPSFTQHLKWNRARGETRCGRPVPPAGKAQCNRPAGHDGPCMAIGTDSCAYGWFVWGPGRGHRWWRIG